MLDSATKSHPVFKAKIRFLVYSGSFKNAPDQISVVDIKTLGPNLFVPELTVLGFFCVVAEYGVCENLRKLEITGVSCRDVYAKRK